MTATTDEQDRGYMALALELAARADYATSPNPMVGCVLVLDDEVVGVGYHKRAGEAHAEVIALQAAGDRGRGATLYVTLEPCSHYGRTPPCVDAIIAAGVARCVIANSDPNPKVAGIDALRAAGISVTDGVLESAARRLNEYFFARIASGRVFVTAKFAASLDGRIATRTGASRWISGPESRRHAHRLRHQNDCILVGVGTILADDPALTARDPEGGSSVTREPVRIVLDSRLRTPPGARVLDRPGTLLVTTDAADEDRRPALRERGAEIVVLPTGADGRAAINDVVAMVSHLDYLSLLVEGGAAVLGAFFDATAVDKVVTYLAPRIIGGSQAPGAVAGLGIADLETRGQLHDVSYERRGDDMVVTGYCGR